MTAQQAEMGALISHLDSWVTTRFTHLERLGTELSAHLRFDGDGHIELTESIRRRLKSIAVRFLAGDETIDGCGLTFAHSALGTENGHLEWWVREDEARFARYSFGVVPGNDRYYDYSHHEWFIQAFENGLPAFVGPYIDYLGVECYVVTLTVPVEVGGVRVGAVGNDIQLQDLESALLPELLRAPREAALVGAHGTVLFGTSSRFLPGVYVPEALEGFDSAPIGPAPVGLRVLYAAG